MTNVALSDCPSSGQHSSNISSNHEFTSVAHLHGGQLCVRFASPSQNEAVVTIWVADHASDAPLSDPNFSVTAPSTGEVGVSFTDFGVLDDQITARDKCTLHIAVQTDGVELSCSF
jgi:hypothetical protein